MKKILVTKRDRFVFTLGAIYGMVLLAVNIEIERRRG